MKLLFIIQKNLRLVFRNWMTFLLLVLGPLLLILITGFAFGGEELHDIFLGVHASDPESIQPVVDALASEEVAVVHFLTIDTCIAAMNHSVVHICADFSPEFREGSGGVTFYYDTTRYNLVRYILEYLKNQVALTSEQISLQATEQIFSDINSFILDMQTGKQQVDELRANALLMREDLVTAHADVVTAQEEFLPPYMRIKKLQAELNATVILYSETYETAANVTVVLEDLTALDVLLTDLNWTLTTTEEAIALAAADAGIRYDAQPFQNAHASLEQAHLQIQATVTSLNSTGNFSSMTLNQSQQLLDQINEIVGYLDAMNASLAATEQKLAQHIVNIDAAVVDLEGLSASFENSIAKFSAITPRAAERFLNPIVATFQAVPEPELNKTALVFPILLIFMLSFISILLSNMLVLNETHSQAYFRNFLVPVSSLSFIVGLFITNLLLIGFQLGVFLLVGWLSFGIPLFLNLPVFLFSVFACVILFVLIGMFFAYLVPERQTSLLLSLFFSLILFFFSDIIFPLEIMPEIASFFAQFNPIVVGEGIFRQVLFYGHGILDQYFAFGVLGMYILFFGILVLAAYSWNLMRR